MCCITTAPRTRRHSTTREKKNITCIKCPSASGQSYTIISGGGPSPLSPLRSSHYLLNKEISELHETECSKYFSLKSASLGPGREDTRSLRIPTNMTISY